MDENQTLKLFTFFFLFLVAQKEKLTELQLRIRQLLNQVDQITKEQNYQRVCLNFI